MADCAVTDVLSDSSALLGDEEQEQFTNAMQLKFFGMAFRELYDLCMRWRLPMGKRTAYAFLPAYTNVLIPSQFGVNDFGEPQALWERDSATTLTVTGATNATPIEITTSVAHGLDSNSQIELMGVIGPVGVNGQWFITVTAANKFTLNGSVAGGAYSSGGTAIVASTNFSPMQEGRQDRGVVDGALRTYRWENDRFYFTGANAAKELKIEYTTSGAAPTSGNVGIDNARNFLAKRTASLVAEVYDMPERAAQLKAEALGPSGDPDGTGGALRGLVGPMLIEKQNVARRSPPFRQRRNAVSNWW